MKTVLRVFKGILITLFLIILGATMSPKCFAQGDVYPVSQLSFTGAGSVCQDAIAPDLVFQFNTVTCGVIPYADIDITVTWFSNTINSTIGGTQVSQQSSTTATTSFSYTVPTTTAGTLYYYVEVSWGTGFITCATPGTISSTETQEIIVNALQPVSVSIGASAATICAGTSVTFTATPTNSGANPSYQWKVNGINVGTDNPIFTSATLVNGDAVTVEMLSDITPCATGNPATSNTVSMTVNALQPVSVSISASVTTICAGTSVTFTATPANGGPSPSYQWKVNGINTGTNSPIFTTATLINGDLVTVEMLSDITPCATGNPATSNTVSMTVNALQPVSVSISASATTICAGTSVTFTATPTNGGTAPIYQWKVNGINTGTNSPIFTTATLVNGNLITVEMTANITPCATGNPATSNIVSMTVNASQPVSVSIAASATTICSGTSVTFTATPTNGGTAPIYQWKVNGINAGTNSSTFTTTTLSNGDVVTVVMTSDITPCATGNPATSNGISMTVNPSPPVVVITTAGTTICQGSIQSLSAASGTASSAASGTISSVIPDFNASGVTHSLNISGIPAGAIVTGINVNFNINHNNDSDLVINLKAPNNNILNLVNRKGIPPSINFTNTVVSSNGVTLFSAGTAPYTGIFAADAAIGVGALGNVSNGLTFNSLYSIPNGNWIISVRDLKLNSIGGTLTSWSVTINWSYPITWSSITDLYSDAGATIAYTNGQILPTVYVKPLTTGNVTYTATATGANGCTNTGSVLLTVNPNPSINATPVTQTVCTGTAITQIDITNPNNVAGTIFTWTRTTPGGLAGIANSGSGSNISGTFTNSTTAPITTTFTITATAGICSSTTTVTVTVNPIPTVSATNTNQTKCSGLPITNIVITNPNAVSGTILTWIRDNTVNLTGIPASGTGTISGTLTNNTNVTQTTIFTITASAGGCSSTTTATVIVNPTPIANATPLTQTICSANSITQIDITNSNSVSGTTYTWVRDNTVNLTGIAASGSGATITGTLTNNTTVQQTTIFTITATSGSCSSTTTVNVKVNPAPVVNNISNMAYCQNGNGAAVVFGSNVAGATFAWTSTANVGFGLSGTGNIPAFTAINSPVTATISVTATASGCPGPVKTFTITVNPLPTITITADYCIVPGKVRLTANPLPAGTFTYLWTTGATTSFIDVDIAGLYGVTVTNTNGCKATNSISVATELAVNGTFEAGNTGFTTGYNYNAAANGLQPEGNYAVNNNPNFNHTNFWGIDHTTGTGKMMIVNGVVGPTVWQETVSVVPNTTYYFSAWALSMNNIPPFAQLQFSVNGSPIGVSAVLVAGVNNNASNTNWQRFYGIWSSGTLTSASCSIVDLQGALGGNDFGLDDISISTLSPIAFYVFPSVAGGGTSVCQGSTLNLSSNEAGGSSPFSFSWTGPNGFTSTLQNPSIPGAGVINTGTYTVTATDFYGCVVSASRLITVTAPPSAASPVTATPAVICLGSSSNLNGTTPSATQSDFAGFYATSNWITTNNPALTGGSINISAAPTQISITSGNNGTVGNTDYTITNGSIAGNFTFNWSYYSALDIASRDIPQYSINGGAAVNLPGFNTAGSNTQNGTASIAVPANQTFALRMRTTTGTLGSATTTFTNFSAPVAGKILWYTVPSAGASIGNSVSAANFPVMPGSTGVKSYYAEAVSPVGCTSSTRTQVDVTVNTTPAFSLCPSNVVTTVTAGTCSKVVSYSATATGSAVPTLTYTFTGATVGSGSGTGSGSTFNKAVTTVTITANTGCAPNATCSFTITVNDNQAPVFSICPSNAIRNTAAGVCTYTAVGTEFNSTATDNCSVTSNTAVLTGATTGSGFATLAAKVFNKGVTTVTWTASDGTNTTTCVFTVTVNDNQTPVFSTCPSNATRNTAAGVCTYTSVGAEFNSTATDNCSVTSKTAALTGATTASGLATLTGQVFNKGVTTVTWTATDGTNNTTCTFTVTVNDNQAPVYSTCAANATRNTNPGTCTYTSVGTEFNSTATDNCSVTSKTAVLTGATTGSGLVTLTGQVFNKGITTVTWTATDGTNNTTCTFTVTVNDNQAPIFSTCPSNAGRNTNPGVCTYTAVGAEFNSAATDNCSVTSKTAVLTGATTGSGLVTLTGQVFNKGVTTVTWTATDGTNNSTCVFTITVTDNEVPVINCQAAIVTCNTTPSLGNPVATDNCPGLTVSNNAPGVFPVGITIVTWIATDASGNTTNCTQSITVNPPAPATPGGITGPAMVCEVSTGFIYSISSVTNATTYSWTVPTGWTITAGAGTTLITVTSGSAVQTGNITVTAGNSCGVSSASILPVSLTMKGTWLGISNDWNTPMNWCGGVPTSLTNVIIPFLGSGIYPVVSSATAAANDIAIATGASVIVNNHTLQIAGTITNNGVFTATNGTIELNGTGTAQNIAGSIFSGHTIKNLRISNSNGVNITGLNDTLKLSGVLKFGTDNAILNTNGNLTLLSTASGTASVGDMTNNAANSGNDIIGNVTVERYIPNHSKAWQFLAVPTKGQTVNAAWQEGNTPLSNSTHPGYGTIITSNIPGAVSLGFDVYTPPGPTMKTYDSATNGWVGIGSPGIQIANKKGYMLLVRGDRSVTTSGQPATTTILRTNGKLYTSGIEAPPVTSLNAGTFESIGNPYASAIDFNKVTKTGGVQDLFYVWDPKLTSSTYSAYGLGAYQTVIGPDPEYTVVPGGGSYSGSNTMIESGQAFLVHAPLSAGSVSFTESCKVDGSYLVTRPSNATVKQLRNNLYVLAGGNPVLLDGTLSQFDNAYSNEVDEMDATKLNNTSENLGILRDGKKLVVERRADIQRTDTIFYNLGQVRVQQYQFEFIAANLGQTPFAAFLEDSYLHTSTMVSLQDTTRILFNVVNVPGSYAPDRFRLVFQQLVPTPVTFTSIAANRNSDKSIAINWKVENEMNMQQYTVERSEDARNFNGIITVDPLVNNGGNAIYLKNDISPLAKDNFYRIKALSFGGQVQYSSIVKVAPVKSTPGISVYPNPVTGNTVQLEFIGQPVGRYDLVLIYSNGVQQKLSPIQLNAGLSNRSVLLPQALASGIYLLKLITPAGNSILKTIHVSGEQ